MSRALLPATSLERVFHEGPGQVIFGVKWFARVCVQAWNRWWSDRCTQAASSLAYQTALALVPLLAVAFALLKASGQLEVSSKLLAFLGQQILPSSEEARGEIVQRLADFTSKIAAGALGSFGLAATIVTGFFLFLSVEEIWNRIWNSTRKRTYFNKFLLFYASVTLGPFLLGLSLWHVSTLGKGANKLQLVASLLSTPVALVLGNRMLPVGRVRWGPALCGGLTSAVLFEAAKYGFGFYLAWITGSYRSIYGALGTLPLFLVWIYVAWLTVLWGAEMAHAAQRLSTLEAAARSPLSHEGDDSVLITGSMAARLLLDVVRHFSAGGKALSADVLRRRHCLSEDTLRRIFRRLEVCHMVIPIEDAYLPARPPAQLLVVDVLNAFHPGEPVPGRHQDGLDRLLGEVTDLGAERLAAVSLNDLI